MNITHFFQLLLCLIVVALTRHFEGHLKILASMLYHKSFIFLTTIWLLHGLLWVTVGVGGQPHSTDVNHCAYFDLKVTGSLVTRLGPLAWPSA